MQRKYTNDKLIIDSIIPIVKLEVNIFYNNIEI